MERDAKKKEIMVLARVIRSEIGGGSKKQKIHVAWVARNIAKTRGKSLSAVACSPCGPQGKARPISTIQKPLESDLKIASYVLSLSIKSDPTKGATHFINPVLQNELAKSGRLPGYKGNTYKKVRRRWKQQYKLRPYYRLGKNLEIWGPKR